MIEEKLEEILQRYPEIWKSKSVFMSWMRGGLRRCWNQHPMKLKVLNKAKVDITNPNPNARKPTVKGFVCEMCNETKVIKECQIDHINPAGSLTRVKDIQEFVERLLILTEDDLRAVCKNCNSALAYSDKYGVSYEEAIMIKAAKKLQDEKKDFAYIKNAGLEPAKTIAGRREQLYRLLV